MILVWPRPTKKDGLPQFVLRFREFSGDAISNAYTLLVDNPELAAYPLDRGQLDSRQHQ